MEKILLKSFSLFVFATGFANLSSDVEAFSHKTNEVNRKITKNQTKIAPQKKYFIVINSASWKSSRPEFSVHLSSEQLVKRMHGYFFSDSKKLVLPESEEAKQVVKKLSGIASALKKSNSQYCYFKMLCITEKETKSLDNRDRPKMSKNYVIEKIGKISVASKRKPS